MVDVPLWRWRLAAAVQFASGSHRDGYLGHLPIGERSQRVLGEHVEQRGFRTWQSPLRAGDATFHSGWLVHGATANRSLCGELRAAMVVTFYPDGTRVHRRFMNPSHAGDAATFLGGAQEGELAQNDATNPIVYSNTTAMASL